MGFPLSQPFHPGYATAEVLEKAKNLKLAVTAGVGESFLHWCQFTIDGSILVNSGSDHIDLNAANKKKITVAEVSGSNVVSVAEHVVVCHQVFESLGFISNLSAYPLDVHPPPRSQLHPGARTNHWR